MEKQHYPYEDYITIRTRTYNANTQYNISYYADKFSEMVIDGQVLTPVRFYDFGDNAFHTVRLKAKDPTTILAGMFQASVYCIGYVRFPRDIETVEQNGLRYLGSSGAVNVIFEDKVPPTMLGNSIGTQSISIYVPDESLEAYKTGAYWSNLASKIHPLSEYTGRYYR